MSLSLDSRREPVLSPRVSRAGGQAPEAEPVLLGDDFSHDFHGSDGARAGRRLGPRLQVSLATLLRSYGGFAVSYALGLAVSYAVQAWLWASGSSADFGLRN